MKRMIKTVGIIFAATSILLPLMASAMSLDPLKQSADITISSDRSASGVWTLPMFSQTPLVELDNYSNYGATGLMSYRFVKAANDLGPLATQPYGNGVSVLNNFQDKATANLYATYDISSGLTSPVPVYEMYVATGGSFLSPSLTIHFPVGWKLLTSWPAAQVNGQTATIVYPTNTSYVAPALVLFQPENMGFGNTISTEGRYTFIGSDEDVAKLKVAVSSLGFADSLFQNSLGLKLPDNVILYAADLSNANVGYEAVALAAQPNLILYNKDLLKTQSQEAIRSTIIHEMTHLVEGNQNLFKGSTYIAPWFKEGLAVFMENQARPYIFADKSEQTIEDLTRQTHMLSASELKVRESQPFDYLFQGSLTQPVSQSYSYSGAVLSNFFNKSGLKGMQVLFAALKDADSAQLSYTADSDKITNAMSAASGLTKDALLFPFKDSSSFASDVASITHEEYGPSGEDQVVSYIKNKIPSYMDGQRPISASSINTTTVPASVVTTQEVSTANCPLLSRSLSFGSKGSDVSSLQQYLVQAGMLSASPTGYFGKATQKAVTQWQSAHGLPTVGIVGAMTRSAIKQACQNK